MVENSSVKNLQLDVSVKLNREHAYVSPWRKLIAKVAARSQYPSSYSNFEIVKTREMRNSVHISPACRRTSLAPFRRLINPCLRANYFSIVLPAIITTIAVLRAI